MPPSVVQACPASPAASAPVASGAQAGADAMEDGRPRLARRENGWCVYLTDDKRCGIYPTRPKVCQEYDCRFLDILTAGAAAVGLVGITLKYADTVEADPYPDWKLRVETPEDRTVLVAYGNVAATPLVVGIVRNPASVVRHPEWDALVAAATSAKETRK